MSQVLALRECPNPECGAEVVMQSSHVQCLFCEMTGPTPTNWKDVAECHAEAARLWNLLPRLRKSQTVACREESTP